MAKKTTGKVSSASTATTVPSTTPPSTILSTGVPFSKMPYVSTAQRTSTAPPVSTTSSPPDSTTTSLTQISSTRDPTSTISISSVMTPGNITRSVTPGHQEPDISPLIAGLVGGLSLLLLASFVVVVVIYKLRGRKPASVLYMDNSPAQRESNRHASHASNDAVIDLPELCDYATLFSRPHETPAGGVAGITLDHVYSTTLDHVYSTTLDHVYTDLERRGSPCSFDVLPDTHDLANNNDEDYSNISILSGGVFFSSTDHIIPPEETSHHGSNHNSYGSNDNSYLSLYFNDEDAIYSVVNNTV